MKSLPLGGGLRSSTLPLGGAGMELESEQWSHGLSLYHNCWLQEIKLCLKDSPPPHPSQHPKKKGQGSLCLWAVLQFFQAGIIALT